MPRADRAFNFPLPFFSSSQQLTRLAQDSVRHVIDEALLDQQMTLLLQTFSVLKEDLAKLKAAALPALIEGQRVSMTPSISDEKACFNA